MSVLFRLGVLALPVAGCGDDAKDDTAPTQVNDANDDNTPPGQAPFRLIGSTAAGLPAAGLLSIWGTGPDNVYIVGADDGSGPVALHYDGTAWSRLATGSSGDLWWVWGDGADTVFMSGELGRMLTYTPSTGAFSEAVIADPAIKLYGVWGASATDVHAVGGDPNANVDGVMLHFDGSAWTETGTAPRTPTDSVRQSFKVWGAASDDVWVVGTLALITHWDGATWTEVQAPLYESTPLTTVHGAGSEAYGVGGFGNAAVVHLDGGTWVDDSPPPLAIAPFFNGVFVHPTHGVVACGGNGQLWWRQDGEWAADPREPVTVQPFHACWIDDEGGVWAVGGDLTSLTEGNVLYVGHGDIPDITL